MVVTESREAPAGKRPSSRRAQIPGTRRDDTPEKQESTVVASQKEDSSDEWVQCAGCEIWVKLSATPFENIEEANAAARYDCTQCVKLSIIQSDVTQRLKEAKEEWTLRGERLEEKVTELQQAKAEWATRAGELEEKVREIQQAKEEWEARAAELEAKVTVIQQGCQKQVAALENRLQGEVRKREEMMAQMKQLQMLVDAGLPKVGRKEMSTSASTAVVQGVLEAEVIEVSQQESAEHSKAHPERGEGDHSNDRMESTQDTEWQEIKRKNRKKKGRTTQSQHQADQTDSMSATPTGEADGSKDQRKVIIAGDVNAYKLKPMALNITNCDSRVVFNTKARSTLKEALTRVETVLQRHQSCQYLVVLHAGMVDLQDGMEPQESANYLRERIRQWRTEYPQNHYLIYANPDFHTEEEENKSQCWNEHVKAACQELGPQVEFVWAKDTTGQRAYKNGHYTKETAQWLGKKLGHRICAFLGITSPMVERKAHPQAWRRSPQSNKQLITALGEILKQMGKCP